MTRRLSPEEPTVTLGLRLRASLLAALDAELEVTRANVPVGMRAKLTRSDAARELLEWALEARRAARPAPAVALEAPPPLDLLALIRAAVAGTATGTASVPHDIAPRLPRDVAPADLHRELLALDRAGAIELRPWSGAEALAPELARWCPPGIDGNPLAGVRLREASRPAAPQPTLALEAPKPAALDLAALHARYLASGRKHKPTARELGNVSDSTLGRWARGELDDLPHGVAERLAALLGSA